MKWWTLLVMLLVLSGLIYWDRALTERKEGVRLQSVRIVPLLQDNPFEQRGVAAIRLDAGQDDVFLYVYSDGLWRCVTAYGAPAEDEPIETIILALRNASGVIRTSDPAAAAAFGFDGPDALRLSVCGSELYTHPSGDVIYALDLGHSIEATGGSYVRPVNSDSIWAVDVDFRAILEIDSAQGAAPMLDPHIVPQAWPGVRMGPARVTIARPGEPSIVITRREREDDGRADALQWEWVVREGESAFLGDLFQVTSYAVFLTRAPYTAILAPTPREQLGLHEPRAIIHYETAEGPEFQLIIGGRGPRGGRIVLNTFTQVVYEVEADIVSRLLPSIDLLLDREQGNPWERWMRR